MEGIIKTAQGVPPLANISVSHSNAIGKCLKCIFSTLLYRSQVFQTLLLHLVFASLLQKQVLKNEEKKEKFFVSKFKCAR